MLKVMVIMNDDDDDDVHDDYAVGDGVECL